MSIVTTLLSNLETDLANDPQNVVIIAGAGVSMATDPSNACASWKGLLAHGLDWCQARCPSLSKDKLGAYRTLLTEGDLIQVANFIRTELSSLRGGEFDNWLENAIGNLTVRNTAVIQGLADLGVRIATTNYDRLIEQVTGRSAITWREQGMVSDFVRGNSSDVLHIHGHYQRPDTVVFDIRDYGDISENKPTQSALQVLFRARTVVFVGCGGGLEDPNFRRLLEWCRVILAQAKFSHYILVPDSQLKTADASFGVFGIRAIAYGTDYLHLGPFLARLADKLGTLRSTATELELLMERQTDHKSRRQALTAERSSLSAADFLRREIELAELLRQAGGSRTAAIEMDSAFHQESRNLSAGERVRFGVSVAEMLLDDGLERMAANILEPLLNEVDASEIPSDVVERFHLIRVRCLNSLCAYGDTLAAIERALAVAKADERARLQAQLAEIHLLQAEVEAAVHSVSEENT